MNKMIKTELEQLGYNLENRDGRLYYNGSLNLEGASITSLPNNLTVGGSLDLRGSSVTCLPDNLTVGGFFDLEATSITDANNIKPQCSKFL